MTKRIFKSIFLAAAGVFLAATVLFLFVLYDYFSGVNKSQLRTDTELAAEAVSIEGEKFFDNFKSGDFRFTLISADGKVLFDTETDANNMENHSEREEFIKAVNDGYGESSRYSATLTERYFYFAKKLPNGDVLRLSVVQNSLLTLFLGMGSQVCFILAIAAVLSAVLASRLSKRIVKPLSELNLDEPTSNDCYDELNPLLKKIESQQKKIIKQREELSRKKTEFEAITNNMSEGLVLLNSNNEIISANCSAARILKLENYETPSDFLYRLGLQNTNCSPKILELDGKKYQLNTTPIKSGEDNIGAVLLLLDVTEREQREQMRREFTANVSHELKTPLQTISGASELLKNGIVKPQDIPEFSEKIYSQAQRLICLIEDIIKLSCLDEGMADTKLENVDLFALSGEVIKSLEAAAEAVDVTVKLNGENAVIKGIPTLVHTIIYNLCDNAIKYNHKGGSVCVTVKNTDNSVLLTVSDTGIGIPPECIQRVFERFYRVDKSRSREIGGTGLGLSIVKHAVKILGAEISIDSVSDKGTDVKVIFAE